MLSILHDFGVRFKDFYSYYVSPTSDLYIFNIYRYIYLFKTLSM